MHLIGRNYSIAAGEKSVWLLSLSHFPGIKTCALPLLLMLVVTLFILFKKRELCQRFKVCFTGIKETLQYCLKRIIYNEVWLSKVESTNLLRVP